MRFQDERGLIAAGSALSLIVLAALGTGACSGGKPGAGGGGNTGAGGKSASSVTGSTVGGVGGTGGGDDGTPIATGPYLFKSVRTGGGGGFIVDILFNPKQKDLIYAKTDMGGVYRWNPAKNTWIQLLNWVGPDDWNMTGAESVATDPSDPTRLYIAGGTYTNGWASSNGVILRSTDQGKTFQVTQMPFKMGGNMPGRGMGERLAVDPNKNSILYFGARDGKGLWKSTDFGATWNNVANFPDTGPYCENPADTNDYLSHPVGIPWVVFDPQSGTPGNATQTIYVGVAQNDSGKANLYRSTNGGDSWEPIPGQPTCNVAGTVVTCTGGATWDMAKTGSDGALQSNSTGYLPHQGKLDSNGTLYVTYSNFEGPYNGNVGDVWKFVPSTPAWTMISPVAGSQYPTNLWWGYGGLAVDLQHPGTLVVAAVNSWWPDGNLYRTTDGGQTWKAAWAWAIYPARTLDYTIDISSAPWLNAGVTNPTPPDPAVKIGWMMEGMNIDPFNSDRMMYGTGATLYGTTNLTGWDSANQFAIKSTAVGIEETSVLGLVSPPSGTPHLYSVVGDVGGWRHDDLDTAPATGFTLPYSGTYNSIDFAETKPLFMVRVGTGNTTATTPYRGTAFTYDGGGAWFQGNVDPVPGQGGGTVAAAADGSRVVWAGSSAPVSYSTDNGNSWHPSTDIPAGSTVASDRVNAQKFFGFGQSKFWTSTDGGTTFVASAATGLPTSGKVQAVFGHEGDVWLTGGSQASGGATVCATCGLWHTTDSGATVTKVLGVTTAEAIGFGMAKPGGTGYPAVFLAGTVNGIHAIFRSDDAGGTWNEITDNQHRFATIQTITGDPRIYGRVYIGTNGLGILYGDIAP